MSHQGCARETIFWGKMAVFGSKMPILSQSKTFCTLISGNPLNKSFLLKILTGEAPVGRQGRKCAILTLKFLYIFCFGIVICRKKGTSPVHQGLELSHCTMFPLSKKLLKIEQAQTNLKMSILSCDFQKYVSQCVQATKRNISFCDSQTLISPF